MAKKSSKDLNLSPDVMKLAEDIAKERGDNLEQMWAQFWTNYILENADIVRKLMHRSDASEEDRKTISHVNIPASSPASRQAVSD